jgi:hypothetical protein
MAILNQAKYLSFDHLYAETVTVVDPTRLANGVAAHRFVTRKGGYPTPAGAYGAGVSIFNIYGVNSLTGYNDYTFTTPNSVAVAGTTLTAAAADIAELAVGAVVRVYPTAADATVFTDLVVEELLSATTAKVRELGTTEGTTPTAITAGAGKKVVRLEAKGGYSVDSAGLNLDYQDRMNTSNTPLAPRVFPYQKTLSICTNGIAIVEVGPSQTFDIDSPVYSDTSGRASTTAGAGVILGRSLDVLTTGASDSGFIRVKLSGVAN